MKKNSRGSNSMSNSVFLSQSEANLLRRQIHLVQKFKDDFLTARNAQTVHDLREASRRLREMLNHVEKALPAKWNVRLSRLTKEITKRLSAIRQSETNLRLLHDFQDRGKADPVVVEILKNMKLKNKIASAKKTKRYFAQKKMGHFEKFVSGLRGLRTLNPVQSKALETRMKEFIVFSWNVNLSDKKLERLRTRTERLRYAIEIQEKIMGTRHGRLLFRIVKLQKLLSQIHDLFVFQQSVDQLRKNWDIPDLKMIPASLAQLSSNISKEKLSLHARIFPAFGAVVSLLPSAFRPTPAKPMRSATALHNEGFISRKSPAAGTQKRAKIRKLA